MGPKRRKRNADYWEMTVGSRRRITYVTNSTQTSPEIRRDNQIIVLIKKLPNKRLFSEIKKMKEKTKQNEIESTEEKRNTTHDQDKNAHSQPSCSGVTKLNDKNEANLQNQDDSSCSSENMESLVTTLRRPDILSRLPISYHHFAKPISNNQMANSTLDNIPVDKPEDFNVNIRKRRRSNFIEPIYTKPGPKCSKKMNLECNRIPIMLDCDQNDRESIQSLSPIMERSERTKSIDTSGMVLEKSLSLNQVVDITDEEVQMNASEINNVSVPRLEDDQDEISSSSDDPDVGRILEDSSVEVSEIVDNPEDPCRIENVPIDCQNNTALVRSNNNQNLPEGSNDQNDNGNIGNQKRKKSRKKYITINTKTVYIHNHFYNQ